MLASEVLGHDAIQQRFSTLFQQQKLPHAWMLYGMQGIGKARLAHILAQNYLCESLNSKGKPCGQCHACHLVLGDSHPDLLHMALEWDDKKKQLRRDIRVEQIRQGLEFLTLTGMKSERRVLILDDANRMNLAAANAVLKGLEEPSAGALLLIVCHDLNALPETIRSRCMLEHCSPLNTTDMQAILKTMGLPEQVFALAMDLAQGCPGHIQALSDETTALACLQWQKITQSLQYADLGEMDTWLQKHVQKVPSELIVSILIQPLQQQFEQWQGDFNMGESLYTEIQAILTWQYDVRTHALRPAPSLLARILSARNVLKRML